MFTKLGFALFVLAVLAAACSKSTTPTANNNNNGGGSGPTFDFAFTGNGISHVFVFPDAGNWSYHCSIHSFMTGTVVVDAASTNDSAVVTVGAGGASVFSPSTVTIHPSGHVRFRSVDEVTAHTATR